MPFYYYQCEDCEEYRQEFRKMAHYKADAICECGGSAKLTIRHTKSIQVNTFKPYVEENFKEPVLIETKQQRDALLAANNMTYDSSRYVRKRKRDAWETDTKVDQAVLEKINAGYDIAKEEPFKRLPFDDD